MKIIGMFLIVLISNCGITKMIVKNSNNKEFLDTSFIGTENNEKLSNNNNLALFNFLTNYNDSENRKKDLLINGPIFTDNNKADLAAFLNDDEDSIDEEDDEIGVANALNGGANAIVNGINAGANAVANGINAGANAVANGINRGVNGFNAGANVGASAR